MEHVGLYKGVKILALGNYYSKAKSFEKHSSDEHSRSVIKFKSGDASAIAQMCKLLSDVLSVSTLKDKSFYVATIPSSTKGKAHAGFNPLIASLAKEFKIINSTGNILKRTDSKTPAHLGGSRDKLDIIHTLSVASEMASSIKGKPVLLLDDITTSSNSLRAGIDLLSAAQANVVVAIAFGKTISG